MLGASLFIIPAIALGTVPGTAEARSDAVGGASQAPSDLNTHADDHGYLPSRRSFYGYPRHRRVDGGREDGGSFGRPRAGSDDASSNTDSNHGSPYYGANYGAPYFGGGYYDGGIYYRERRD